MDGLLLGSSFRWGLLSRERRHHGLLVLLLHFTSKRGLVVTVISPFFAFFPRLPGFAGHLPTGEIMSLRAT